MPEVAPGVHERPPQLDRAVDRVVQLERGLAGERQAHHVAGHAGDVGVDVAEEPRRVGQAEPAQQLRRERTGDVDRGEGHRPVHDVDAEAPRLDPVADPHLGVGRAAGRERQDEPASPSVAQDHPVVHHVAALVEEQRVARAAGLDVGDVARVDPLERLDDVRPADDQLAERRDVADRDALADRPVLADGVAVVPRPPPAAEPVHPGAEREVLVVQRRPAERVDVGVGGGLGEGDLAGGGPGRERLRAASPVRAAIHARTWGRQAPPWHGPRPPSSARLSSSSSGSPCPTRRRGRRPSCPCTGRRRPSVGGGGSGWSTAAEPTDARPARRGSSGPGRRAARGRGRR